ncbi:MAG TPA: hypothetical protein VF783_16155 [Terriglobales bacterium]
MHKNKKQLIVLLCVASWISIAVYWAFESNPKFIGLAFVLEVAFIYSIPALMFGAILFWWFRD